MKDLRLWLHILNVCGWMLVLLISTYSLVMHPWYYRVVQTTYYCMDYGT